MVIKLCSVRQSFVSDSESEAKLQEGTVFGCYCKVVYDKQHVHSTSPHNSKQNSAAVLSLWPFCCYVSEIVNIFCKKHRIPPQTSLCVNPLIGHYFWPEMKAAV